MGFDVDDKRVLGLIPARGGSKSIPLKNIAQIANRPMISYVIAAAKDCRLLDRILCSTDHKAIADECNSRGIEVAIRPARLAQDDTPVTAVIIELLKEIGSREGVVPGAVALLQPTSPFLRPIDIDMCIETLQANPDADSVQTVAPVEHNAHAFNQRVISEGRVQFRFLAERREMFNKQRKPKHFVFGNLVVSRSKSLLDGKDCFGDRSIPIEIPRVFALDVDTADDLDFATYLVQHGKAHGVSS